ncbi:MAG: hypothetical protein LBN30_09735 [Oscillospiraceae bacterium]|jgi:DNA repair exonuclease SbcCD ATPase subunit|nr:hypothetical protein [Oscillospiraceae bacterium]
MDKIQEFTVSEITIGGFKNFAEPRTFTFGAVNAIVGHNGQGKTTIAEAVAYALTGVPFYGEAGLDRLYTLENKAMTVALTIVADGESHRLVRSRRYDVTDITYDGYTIRQSELTMMFGEKDVFLAIFNPLYFIEILEDKGRNLLERYLPAVTPETVLANMSESTRSRLDGVDLSSPDTLLVNIRAMLRDMEKTITYTEGQRDILGAQGIENAAALTQKQAELSELDAEIRDLEQRKVVGIDFDALTERRRELYARYSEAQSDKRVERKLAQASAAYESARARYAREVDTYKKLRPGTQCPMCKRAITEQNLDAIKKEFADSLTATKDEGNRQKQILSELQAEARTDETALAALKAEIQSVETDIEYGGINPDEKWRLDDLKKDAENLRVELATLEAARSVTSEDKERELGVLRERADNERELETAVRFYLEERASLMFSGFDMLNRVKIVLYDTVKTTGEAKSVFKFSYDGKPYKFLSLSEKIKAGLEISELLKKLTDRRYPVFIDNGESVPVIDNIRPTGQLFIAQVVKGAPLEVKIQNTTMRQTEKAAA